MFCSNCGKENSNDSKFCFNCGNSLAGQPTPVVRTVDVELANNAGVTAIHIECPACQSVNSLVSDNSEKVSTKVSVVRITGVVVILLCIPFIILAIFAQDQLDRLFAIAAGAIALVGGLWLMKVADAYRGYSCTRCGASMLLDIQGNLHINSKSDESSSESGRVLLIGAVAIGLIVLVIGFTSTLNQTSNGAGLASQNIEYSGFKLGMSKNDVIQTNSNFKTIKGSNGIDYYAYGKNPQIMVHFDTKSLKVRQIGCWVNVDKKFPSNSCLINGIKVGDTKEMVLNMLGDPDRVLLNSNGTKSFLYKNINLEFGIFEGRVFEVYLIDQKSHDSIQYELKNAPNVIPLY